MKNKSFMIIFVFILLGGIFVTSSFTNNDIREIFLGDSNTKGDVNGNGKVDSADYVLVRKYIMKSYSLKDAELKRADVNGDNKVTSQDYIMIKKIIMGGESTVAKLSIEKSPTVMIEGSEEKIISQSNEVITWTSSNNSIASVTSNGIVKGTGAGSVKITATTSSGLSKSVDIKVYSKKVSIVDTFNVTNEYIVADYNVLTYGADPTGEKDSTAAFKKALQEASNGLKAGGKGGVVFVPKGRYKITEQLTIDRYVGLIGDLAEGTTDGSLLMLYYGKGKDDYQSSAIKVNNQGAIKNIAFYYPEQVINASGVPITYPPTILSTGHDGLTLDNIMLVNSYIGIDLASNSGDQQLPLIYNVYGTPLHIGIISNMAYDVPRMSNINFSSKYWLNSTIGTIPNTKLLKKVLSNSNKKPLGIALEKADWFYLTNINISDYYYGIILRDSTARTTSKIGNAEGQMYNVKITNCTYPIYDSSSRHVAITNATLSSSGGTALYIEDNTSGTDISINSSSLSGNRAIYNGGNNSLSITSSTIDGAINRKNVNSKITFVTDTLKNTGFDGSSWTNNDVHLDKNFSYKTPITKPKSNKLVVINARENEDITSKLNNAINSLSSGGIIYIPAGTYTVSNHIDVKSGIEIRGSISWAHYTPDNRYEPVSVKNYHLTWIKTNYKGGPLFTLYDNSGINGLTITYTNLIEGNIESYPYAIQGHGSNVYIKNVTGTAISKGVDLFTYQNDNHYVEHLFGEFYEMGIKIGGNSQKGLVKDCHFNPNVLPDKNWTRNFNYIMSHQTSLEIGKSSNEVLVGNFSYGSNIGHNIIDGANKFVVLGSGSDYSKSPLQINGNVNGELINPLLTTIPNKASSNCNSNTELYCGNDPSKEYYIKSNDSFTGFVNIVNSISWLNNQATAFYLNGKGDLHLYGGIIDHAFHQTIIVNNSLTTIVGLIINPSGSPEFIFNPSVTNATIAGNICVDGNCEVHNGGAKQYVNGIDGIK